MSFFVNLKDKVNINLLYMFALCIPLGQKLSTYVLIIWILSSLVFIKQSKKVFNKRLFLLPALYFVYILSLTYTEEFSLKFFEQKGTLLAFPIIFYLNGYKYNSKIFNRALFFFVIGCVISVFYCYSFALYNSIDFIDNTIVFKPEINPELTFIESSVKGGNYFYGNYFSVLHQTVYYAMFLCLAISILLFKPKTIKNRAFNLLVIIVFSITVFQVSSRAGVVTLIMLTFIYVYKIFNKKLFKLISVLILLIALPSLLILNPRLKNASKNVISSFVSFHNEDIGSSSLRLMTWDASLQVIKKNIIIGVGVGDAYKELKEEYRKKRYVKPYRDSLNSHNQYFQLLVECGLIAFLLFFTQLFSLYKQAVLRKDIKMILMAFFIIISFNSMFESIFNQYSGIMFYSFFFCLLINNNKNLEVL
ncbi:O-antigen ligase family protein [Psychroserpens sp. NJDZ02]|uniref:O-antigen ligase family protein n=1 Tax=Psychroserpens sp. NJDZ02 TaxID=2570561 RepID=UPI0010A8DC28|nr:O-antigen ligase family protein [Psychroserpens sp. NJDZ02]QCE41154.1 O-antigen ligase family protein [Psychroserpens sp. NJDZ02]